MSITIGATLICGDKEIDTIKQLIQQLSKFDQVVIGFNGTDPKNREYLLGLGEPYEIVEFEWRGSAKKDYSIIELPEHPGKVLDARRFESSAGQQKPDYYPLNDWGFAYARNKTWEKLTTSHGIWIDSDDLIGFMRDGREVIVTADQAYKAFRKIATEADPDVNCWFSTYIYSRDSYNNPNVIYARERMIKNPQEWTWIYPIHEVLLPKEPPKWTSITDVQWIHFPRKRIETAVERNQRMLQEWIEQLDALNGPQHDRGRAFWYLADTYWAMREYRKSANIFVQFVREHPEALDIEKWQAWIYTAKCQIELNNFEAASAAALASIEIEPGLSDGYILLAQCKLITEQDPQDILVLIDIAGRMQEPPSQVIQNPLDYTYTTYCIVSRCKYLLGQYDAALEWALKACKVCPEDEKAEWLRVEAATKVRERDATESAKALYQLYRDYDENEKAAKLYELLPYPAQHNEGIQELAIKAANRVRHLYDKDAYIEFYQNIKQPPIEIEKEVDSGFFPGIERFEYITKRLKMALPNGGRILDIGCSDGLFSLSWAKMGYEVVGVDLDSRFVDQANEIASRREFSAKFVAGLFEDMNPETTLDPFDGQPWYNHFDAVIAGEVIEHVQNPDFFLGCLVDCAKPEAPIIITTPDEAFDKGDKVPVAKDDEETALHVRAYTQETFEHLLKKDPDIHVTESRFLPAEDGYRYHQGWQVGEVRKMLRPDGPIIRIYCGPNIKFNPSMVNNPKEEIAGSELAVVAMAKELAKLGCQVVVYSGFNGIYDGVFYRTADKYDLDHYSDIFISWRIPTIFSEQRPNAKLTLLWTHDLYYDIKVPDYELNEIPQEWVDRIDKVMVVSEFHEKFITNVNKTFKGKTWVTRNGIDPSEYIGKEIEKFPHRYFYCSDWSRGIDELVYVWPMIKKAIPDAELHVAYSYELLKRFHKNVGNKARLKEIEQIRWKLDNLPGCTYHDRLGHQELAELQLSCAAWLYPPNDFLETYCITAVEAQAAGAVPISRLNGALPETVKSGYHWQDLDDPKVIEILKTINPNDNPFGIKKAQEWALAQTWEELAKEWLVKFYEFTEESNLTES